MQRKRKKAIKKETKRHVFETFNNMPALKKARIFFLILKCIVPNSCYYTLRVFNLRMNENSKTSAIDYSIP